MKILSNAGKVKILSLLKSILLFEMNSPVALVTTVGVLTEVPVMLLLVAFVNRTKGWFDKDE